MPAYIDPKSKYRYYMPEQIVTLDSILFCIELGIPLKEFKNYIDGDIFLVHKFLEDGKHIAETKLENIRTGLKKTEYYLQNQNENKQFQNETGQYQREIRERFIITQPYNKDLSDIRHLEKSTTALYDYAQEQNMVPVIPCGIILQYVHKKTACYIFLEVLSVDTITQDNICKIPLSTFSCIRKSINEDANIFSLIEKEFGVLENRTVLITNIKQDKRQFNNRQSEIQVADTLFQL